MSNRIIVATDFSPAAQNAVKYAAHLAQHLQVPLEMLHAYIIPFAYTDSPVPLLNIDEIQKIAEDSMQAASAEIEATCQGLTISQRILPGDLIDCLAEVIENDPPMLVVLGKSGSGNSTFFWGSMAVNALRNLTIPVLAIPAEVNWTPIKKIAFAADYKQFSEDTPLEKIRQWVEKMKASLTVLHVDRENDPTEIPAQLQQGLAALQPEYQSMVAENIETIIGNFVTEHQINWLMVIPKKYGFFENIFHKSRTKGLTQNSKIPVLALHQVE